MFFRPTAASQRFANILEEFNVAFTGGSVDHRRLISQCHLGRTGEPQHRQRESFHRFQRLLDTGIEVKQ
jgi:hypothetical protein